MALDMTDFKIDICTVVQPVQTVLPVLIHDYIVVGTALRGIAQDKTRTGNPKNP